ncbi:hypothetical protein EV363DRAFT_518938 [Boletus edulis]|nr:hypothetical protein EV363DRAFT_518938 [Boletus edulis]
MASMFHTLKPQDTELGLLKSNLDIGYEPRCAEAQLSTGSNLFSCRQGSEPEWPSKSLDAVYPLPRSSPFPSSSPSSDNSILDLDTSPCAAIRPGQSDDLSEDESLRSICWPRFRQPSGSFSIREGLTCVDEAQLTMSSPTHLNEEVPENERFRTTYCNDGRASLSAENYDSPSSDSAHDSISVLASKEVTEDDAPNDVWIDFLSDPCPWETIGRILKLNAPEPSAAHSVKVNFTKDREGVGYVSYEGSRTCPARSFDATFEMQISDKLTVDIHVASSANSPILDPEVSTTDDRMAIDTPDLPCGDNPLFDAGLPSVTPAEVNSYINVHAPQVISSIPVVHSTQDEHTRSSTPFTIVIGATTTKPEINTTVDGPCLFGDSDLEEDE